MNCLKCGGRLELHNANTTNYLCNCKKEKSGNLPEANRNAVLAEVLAEIQGYEPDCNQAMTTQSNGRWIEREEVLKLLEKHCA